MFEKLSYFTLLFITILFLLPDQMFAQEEIFSDSLVSISLTDGTTIGGSIVFEDEEYIIIKTLKGLEVKTPKSLISSIKPFRGKLINGKFYRPDPNYSRLLYATTGRPLRRGEGHFSDYYIFFPSVSYGLTNQISVMAGFSIIPGLDFSQQVKYVAPKIGIQSSDEFALSVGAIYFTVDDLAYGIAFVVGTFGEHDKSITTGIGLGYSKEEGRELEFTEHPIIMLGGNIRLTEGVALLSENWLITGRDFNINEQPLSLALRLFGDHLAADLGFIIIGDQIKEGFPIPWLSFTYNFGK